MFIPRRATSGRMRLTSSGQISGLKESLDLTGDVELMEMLKSLPDDVYRNVIQSASRKSMAPVAARAKELAPEESGTLKASIGTKKKEYKRAGVVVTLVGPRQGFKQKVAVMGPNGVYRLELRNPANYAHLVEFGVQPHALFSGADTRSKDSGAALLARSIKQHPGIKAKPFMRPAFDENISQIVATFKAEIPEYLIRKAKSYARNYKKNMARAA